MSLPCDLSSASVTAVLYAISCYIGQYYNDTWPDCILFELGDFQATQNAGSGYFCQQSKVI